MLSKFEKKNRLHFSNFQLNNKFSGATKFHEFSENNCTWPVFDSKTLTVRVAVFFCASNLIQYLRIFVWGVFARMSVKKNGQEKNWCACVMDRIENEASICSRRTELLLALVILLHRNKFICGRYHLMHKSQHRIFSH